MKKKRGRLFIISGPSGAGKSSLIDDALKDLNDFVKSVSVTTRQKRINEVDGVRYRFVSKKEFEELKKNDSLLECAGYSDCLYGTPKNFVEEQLNLGKNVILEIEVKGATQVKEKIKDAYLIFITASSLENLKERLVKRGTEKIEEIRKRLKISGEEIKSQKYYDCIIVNNDYNEALQNLKHVLNTNKGGS